MTWARLLISLLMHMYWENMATLSSYVFTYPLSLCPYINGYRLLGLLLLSLARHYHLYCL